MKCKICSERASAEVPQHHMALCRPCYLEWFPRYAQRTIEKYRMIAPEERLLVAVSGGKDSQALWSVLTELGYAADGMVIDLGIGDDGWAAAPGEGYSAESTDYVRELAERLGRPLWVLDLRELLLKTVPEVRRGSRPVCSACGVVKRYLMNRVAFEGGYDCIATGHNLDDEAAALFGNVLSWDTYYLGRQSPISPQVGERLMKKIKPFCYFTERETAMYALSRQDPLLPRGVSELGRGDVDQVQGAAQPARDDLAWRETTVPRRVSATPGDLRYRRVAPRDGFLQPMSDAVPGRGMRFLSPGRHRCSRHRTWIARRTAPGRRAGASVGGPIHSSGLSAEPP